MDDARGVRLPERIAQRERITQSVGAAEPTLAQDLAETSAAHQFHGNEMASCVGIDVIDCDDVGMVQGRGALCFAREPLRLLRRIGVKCGQQFERDFAVQPRVQGTPDHAHPPSPHGTEQFVVKQVIAFSKRRRSHRYSERPIIYPMKGRNFIQSISIPRRLRSAHCDANFPLHAGRSLLRTAGRRAFTPPQKVLKPLHVEIDNGCNVQRQEL